MSGRYRDFPYTPTLPHFWCLTKHANEGLVKSTSDASVSVLLLNLFFIICFLTFYPDPIVNKIASDEECEQPINSLGFPVAGVLSWGLVWVPLITTHGRRLPHPALFSDKRLKESCIYCFRNKI